MKAHIVLRLYITDPGLGSREGDWEDMIMSCHIG